jgi:hypothetical protein
MLINNTVDTDPVEAITAIQYILTAVIGYRRRCFVDGEKRIVCSNIVARINNLCKLTIDDEINNLVVAQRAISDEFKNSIKHWTKFEYVHQCIIENYLNRQIHIRKQYDQLRTQVSTKPMSTYDFKLLMRLRDQISTQFEEYRAYIMHAPINLRTPLLLLVNGEIASRQNNTRASNVTCTPATQC